MNEQMTAAGTAGGGDTKAGKGAGKGAGKTSTRSGRDGGFGSQELQPGDPTDLRPGDPGTLSPGDPGYNDPGEGGQFPEDPYPGRGPDQPRLIPRRPGSRPFGPEDAVSFPRRNREFGIFPIMPMPPQFSPMRHYKRNK